MISSFLTFPTSQDITSSQDPRNPQFVFILTGSSPGWGQPEELFRNVSRDNAPRPVTRYSLLIRTMTHTMHRDPSSRNHDQSYGTLKSSLVSLDESHKWEFYHNTSLFYLDYVLSNFRSVNWRLNVRLSSLHSQMTILKLSFKKHVKLTYISVTLRNGSPYCPFDTTSFQLTIPTHHIRSEIHSCIFSAEWTKLTVDPTNLVTKSSNYGRGLGGLPFDLHTESLDRIIGEVYDKRV